jgi:hypothetical protein
MDFCTHKLAVISVCYNCVLYLYLLRMHSADDLDDSKFVPDYNKEMTIPSQSSQDDVLLSITSSLCSADVLVVDEVRCSSDDRTRQQE